MASEASARQDAALSVLRLLDAHIRSIAFHAESPPCPQHCPTAPSLPACRASHSGIALCPARFCLTPYDVLRMHVSASSLYVVRSNAVPILCQC